MINVFESVESNKHKSWLVVAGFVGFVLAASYLMARGMAAYYGYESTGLEFLGLGLVISGVMSFASYYFSDRVVLGISGATPANRKKDFLFYTVAENMALAAGMPVPKLYKIDDTAMNAFATGRDPQHAAICATTGLLTKLNRTELEGVIGHEMSHIANYDTRLMSIVTILVGLLALLGDWLLRSTFWGRRSRDDEDKSSGGLFLVLGLFMAVISPVIAQIIQLAISRRREFLADASSVKLTRQPSGLISALKKLGADKEPLEAANRATAHLYIVYPFKGLAKLFNTHPSLTERIKALESMA